jgi:Putative Actinobacterial Holin-X, holin superfamily III
MEGKRLPFFVQFFSQRKKSSDSFFPDFSAQANHFVANFLDPSLGPIYALSADTLGFCSRPVDLALDSALQGCHDISSKKDSCVQVKAKEEKAKRMPSRAGRPGHSFEDFSWHEVCTRTTLPKENVMADLAEQNLTSLAGKVVHDSEKLLGQQLDLFRAEVEQEFHRLGDSAFVMLAGVSLASGGFILVGFMLAYVVQLLTDWPLWAGFGVVGGICIAAGVVLVHFGRVGLAKVQVVPKQTLQAVKENVTWLKEQIKGPST